MDTLMADHGHCATTGRRPVSSTFTSGTRSAGSKGPVRASHQRIGGCDRVVGARLQGAIRALSTRRLIRASRQTATAVPGAAVLRPWRR